MSSNRLDWIAGAALVAAVCALGLVLRLRGLEHSLPHATFRDGYYVFTQVESMRAADPNPERNPFWGIYPHLVARTVAALPDPNAEPLPDGAGLTANLERAAAPWMQIRAVSIALSLLAVAAAFGVSRAFLSRGWSAFAATLVAASLLEIFFAQQEKCHGAAAGTAALAVLAAMHLRRRPTLASFALAGIASGLAIATLQSGAAVLLPCVAAVVFAWRDDPAARRRIAIGSVLALALVALALRAFYPHWFSGRELAREGGLAAEPEGSLGLSGHHIEIERLDGGGFAVILDTLISFEPVALLLGVVGLVALLARRRNPTGRSDRGDLWVVLAYVVPYTLAVGVYGLSYERFVMPLVPFLAVLAAAGARALAELVTSRIAAPTPAAVVRGAIAAVALAPALALAWKLGSVRAADDTYEEAAAWISRNAEPERDRIHVLPYLDLPLFYAEDALRENVDARKDLYWLMWQSRLRPEQRQGPRFSIYLPKGAKETKQALGDDPLAYFRGQGVDYVVLQEVAEDFRFKALPESAAALREGAELVARYSPLANDTGEAAKLAIRYTRSAFERPFFVHLLNLRCEGMTLEIYRLSERGGATGAETSQSELDAEIAALEAIGYAGGTTAAGELEGVTTFDEQRACAGLNVLVSGDATRAELVDMRGRTLHTWQRTFDEVWPGRQELPAAWTDSSSWRRVRVLEHGELLAIYEGLGLVKLDRDSNVLWSYDGLAHHAFDIAPDGRILVLTRKAKLEPRFHPEKPILEDFVTTLDGEGRELESISLLECFERSEKLAPRAYHAGDIFHTNSLQILDGRHVAQLPAFAAGNVLVSLRNTNQIAVVDLRARAVPWVLVGSWREQHEPVLLDSGHVLLFDNLGRRGRSSVIELDPRDGEVVWKYTRPEKGEFYSSLCGSAQRLENGNTLVVSSEQGRAFELTPESEIVWEYWNPRRFPGDPTLVALLFDCVRLPRDFDTSWMR